MNDKINPNNNGNASSREDPNKNSCERGPSEEPPVKKRRNEFEIKIEANKMSVLNLIFGDFKEILSDLKRGKDITTCDDYGRNAMHYASALNWFNVVEAIVNKPSCRGSLINSLTRRRESPLVIAAKNSHKNIVIYLLNSGANFKIGDEYGMTLLHHASVKGWLDIVQDVLGRGFDIDALTSKRETALIVAAKHSNKELVSFLIGMRANCSYCNQDGWGILHYSSKNGWLNTVLTVVNNRVDIDAKTVESETALLLAAKFSYKEIVKALIRLGANVHCCDSKGWSLLHYASSYGWFDVVISVVKRDADIDSKTDIAETPLLLAAKNSYEVIVKYFIYLGVNFTCIDKFGRNMLIYSSRNGWIDITKYAVERGIDPNAETAAHITALQLAAVYKKKDVTSFLISVGANFRLRDQYGWTILHYAAAHGWCDVAQRVLKEVDVNAKTFKSSTVLEIACVHCQKEVVTFLIDAGVDIHFTDSCNKTILHYAAKYGWLDVVQSAAEKGVYVDSLCVDNETALLVAAQHSHPDVACLLSVFGANVDLFDRYEKTVLHYAAEKGWVDVTESAIKNGADLDVMNDTEDTPLHLACMYEEIAVLKCLLQAGADYNKIAPGPRHYTPFSYAVKKGYVQETSAIVEAVKLFIENGAFPEIDDCVFISETPLLKEGILLNEKLCARALINKFNSQDLPKIFALPFSVNLPPIDKAKIGENQMVVKVIEDHVQQKINTKGYCDLIDLYYDRPCTLSMLSVRALLVTYHRLTYVC